MEAFTLLPGVVEAGVVAVILSVCDLVVLAREEEEARTSRDDDDEDCALSAFFLLLKRNAMVPCAARSGP